MNKISLDEMRLHVEEYLSTPCKVLDVGSMDVNKVGCHRDLFTDADDYTGVDLEPGKNVDIVLEAPYTYPFPDDTFDAVLCSNVMEHCKNPFNLVEECARVLKPGGVFLVCVPSVFPIHRYPVDCWRILPDGMEALFEHAGLRTIKTYETRAQKRKRPGMDSKKFCWGVAIK